MSDEIELERERDMSRDEIAEVLETFAGNLRGSDPIEVELGDRVVAIDPPETVEFELEIEDEPDGDAVERSVEFELEWNRRDSEDELPDPSAVED
ncbi:amphi-Trp domain-containing protein [Halovivax sp.]|uniref:amphi-Trp domain-containing protein n=1 Tax=Halovivax sp. TaxID=1935978 RepID=UPI0025B95ECC|nr:amphi-Trp domain-containing protein [Halovivax sp.]